jgi:FtsP/CotA-like multicopper oxidase with cupredoxin domain
MMWTRRDFLSAASMAGAIATLPRGVLAATERAALNARVENVQLLLGDYPKTEIWGYGGELPGSEIRLTQGARLQRRLLNELPQATSVHWHGIRGENAMDGVAGLTQDAVPPGAYFDYDFTVNDAGTFWYHSHNRSVEQVARGLYGALIVEEASPPDIDRDEVLVLDDWLLDPETGQINAAFDSQHDRSHAGRRGNYVTTNGQPGLTLAVRRHERLRLRLINAANARIFQLRFVGLEGWTVALDGMPLAAPEALPETLILGPGQRADLFVDVVAEEGKSAFVGRIDDGQGYAQATFAVSGTTSAARRDTPAPLPPNPSMEVSGIATARRLRLDMAGGAMGSLRSAVLDGKDTGFAQMVAANQFWAFNDAVGMTDKPLASLNRGETVRLAVFNDTAFPHAMHLHGMHFREVLKEGGLGPLRDTLLMFGDQTREIAFVADNPGDWLFHCHMLSHAASGMMTWMRVET